MNNQTEIETQGKTTNTINNQDKIEKASEIGKVYQAGIANRKFDCKKIC
jgi:hypothetical protein